MSRTLAVTLLVTISSTVLAGNLQGTYVEARTCQVYTGPCFANGEVGLAGKNAVMSWRITDGYQGSVDLQGLSVAVIVNALRLKVKAAMPANSPKRQDTHPTTSNCCSPSILRPGFWVNACTCMSLEICNREQPRAKQGSGLKTVSCRGRLH